MAAVHSGNCYRCQKPGHWSKDCPERSGAVLSSCFGSSRTMPAVTSDPEFPSTHCRCGKGLCNILVCKKETNRNRKFYRCPGAGAEDCNYFKWCDELREDQVLVSPPELKFPTCGCQAGVCRLVYEPNAGRSYFCCPIKKKKLFCLETEVLNCFLGEGACNFFLWQDDYIMTASDDQNGSSINPEESVDAQFVAHNNSSVEVLEQLEGPGTEDLSPGSSPRQLPLKHGVPGMTAENVATKPSANNAEVSPPNSGVEPPALLFKRQMATLNTPADSVETSIWMPEYTTAESEKRMKFSPCSTQALRKLNLRDIDLKSSNHQKDLVAGYVDEVTVCLKTKLFSTLESLDPSKHKVMLDMANHTFSLMKDMDADFHNRVMEYISRAAALTEVEQFASNHLSSEELKAKYDAQRSHFEEISREQTETISALTIVKQNGCDLRAEVTHFKDMASAAEGKLSACVLEIESLEASLYEISEEMIQSKECLRDVAEALKCLNRRDIDLGAARAAFEIARAKLYL